MSFRGFPPAAFEFYERLEADNSKVFWQANKATYEEAIRGPMTDLAEELAEFGPFRLYRPYNDVRFAKGRPVYKTNIGAIGESEDGAGHYFALSAIGMTAATGYYVMAADQLDAFRAAVDDDDLGSEVEGLVQDLERKGYRVGAMSELKTAPRGVPKDHPRIALLRRKGLMVWREWPVSRWMHTRQVVGKVRDAFTGAAALNAWLDRHVGPSTLPPPDLHR